MNVIELKPEKTAKQQKKINKKPNNKKNNKKTKKNQKLVLAEQSQQEASQKMELVIVLW